MFALKAQAGSWQHWSNPAAAGFDPARFARVTAQAQSLGSAGLFLVREGRALSGLGDPAWRANTRSIRKSILCALIGIAVARGQIDLAATLRDLDIRDREGLSEVERGATVADLLAARSGIMHPAGYESEQMKALKAPRHAHAPGLHWCYNNWDFNALGTVFQRCTRRSIPEAFSEDLAEPLGMEDFRPGDATYVDSAESVHPAYPITLSARDLARFGLLWLQEGWWDNRQIVPANWVRAALEPRSDAGEDGSYGRMWWVSRDGAHLPGLQVPPGTYSARGWGGHHLIVVPRRDLVVVHRAQTEVEPFETVSKFAVGRILAGLLGAIA